MSNVGETSRSRVLFSSDLELETDRGGTTVSSTWDWEDFLTFNSF